MKDENSQVIKALRCEGCERLYYPPRYHCSKCGGSDFSNVHLDGNGEVYSYTVIRMPFEEFLEDAPFAFAEITLDEGLVVPGRFVNEEEKQIQIGSRVSFVNSDKGVLWFRLT